MKNEMVLKSTKYEEMRNYFKLVQKNVKYSELIQVDTKYKHAWHD